MVDFECLIYKTLYHLPFLFGWFLDYDKKANDAVDFSDINEVADEETERVKEALTSMTPSHGNSKLNSWE